ncbi:MAG: hypothetical protein A2Y25_04850 [Candidatus Melainabacteria bacterium GWF2_37_15]|nr:MAG: hypothetical protein A2Y25_04850 [Candidatus Melainabacteria bacterium GWF2_37_15]
MDFLLGPVLFILNLIAIYDVITGPKNTTRKILWVLAILFLPVVGLILYYVIGKKNLFARPEQP